MSAIPQIRTAGTNRHGLCAGRRPRQPVDGAHRPARQAGGVLRLQIAHHRFRAVERTEFRHPPHRRGDAVQGAQPDPPPAARLELLSRRTQRKLRHPARDRSACRRPSGTPARPMPCTRTSTSSRATGRSTSSSSPATMSTRWTTSRCCRCIIERQADVTVGCIEVPRCEAIGFGVMAIDGTDRILSFLEKPKDPPGMPDKPDMALASMGIYVFATKFLFDQLRRDAADPNSSRDFGKDLIPHLVKHGKAIAHRFTDSCVRSRLRGRSLLARRRHARRLLASQHRPDRRDPAARSLRQRMADLDLWRDHAAGEIRARRGWPPRAGDQFAGLRRLHHLRRLAAPLAAVHRRARAFLSPASRRRVVMPYVDIGRSARLTQRHRRSRRAHSGRPGGRRGSADCDAQALSPHRAGRLPDHPADDRPIDA